VRRPAARPAAARTTVAVAGPGAVTPPPAPAPAARPAPATPAADDDDIFNVPEPESAGPASLSGRTQTFYPTRMGASGGKGPNLLAPSPRPLKRPTPAAVQPVRAAAPAPAAGGESAPVWQLVALGVATFAAATAAVWCFLR